ncbi:uncharacterized protein LOC127747670 [Arachis duranensis]|uniref:Uncharacterized protein LOC127747670 n=1 Tax=Arachis duranensis TaxID=130453 RepID=A0A9C6WTM4_ARADU|nr:uncharacterized protein LOC127747670 [Arachis duranensis]
MFKNVLVGYEEPKQDEINNLENFDKKEPVMLGEVKGRVDPVMVEKIKKIGLVFETEESMKEALYSSLLLNHFGEIRSWVEEETNRSRKVLINIHGISLHGWSEENFLKIVDVWETMIKLDLKIIQSENLSLVKALVDTTWSPYIQNRVMLELEGSKKKGVIAKLDFKKAYNTIRWVFVDHVLECMSFGEVWRKWIRGMVNTAVMSIIVNGTPTELFPMERDLCQGDPISLFLFILMAEVLNQMLIKTRNRGFPPKRRILRNYRRVLTYFGMISGLVINYQKSTLIPINVHNEEATFLVEELNCPMGILPITYLGIPLEANPKRIDTWKPMVEKMEKKLWK